MVHSHKELCAMAAAWLQRPSSRNGPGCTISISETANFINDEIPDAIGWRVNKYLGGGSVLVEVKTTRSDFLVDAKKPHRLNPEQGMGKFRYYMAPEGLLKIDELPEKWGLLEVNSKGHIKVRAGHVLCSHNTNLNAQDWIHKHNEFAETCTLALVLNRVGDPQKVQDWLRESQNKYASLSKAYEALRKREEELETRLHLLLASKSNQ